MAKLKGDKYIEKIKYIFKVNILNLFHKQSKFALIFTLYKIKRQQIKENKNEGWVLQ
jgi:hypothetical protein